MPSYKQCSKDEATHLEVANIGEYLSWRGATAIVHKVPDGCLVVSPNDPKRHHFVRDGNARFYKEYVPPVVTYGVGRMDKVHTPYGDIPALALGEGRLTDRKACEEFMRRSTYVKWTHLVTYHDKKPVAIEELL
jgi:hypothetical protein